MVALGLAACGPPDRPAMLDVEMPDRALDYLRPDSVRERELHPGVMYRYVWSSTGPWGIHFIQAALGDRCDLGFDVLRAEGRDRGEGGRERVSAMVARADRSVLAAINADFFTPEGTAVGTEVVDGSVRTRAARPTFAWRPGSSPWMGVARPDDEGLVVGWTVPFAGGDGVTEAVGGFPDLIDGGQRVRDLEVADRPSFAAARHPRSAVGYDSVRGQLWLVLVDGRQVPYSAGMSLPELAGLFEALGADEAINLDGGGSSVLVVQGVPVNRPSDAAGERAVVNALALVTTPELCRRP